MASRLSIGLFLLPAGIAKLADLRGFREGLRAYDLLKGNAVVAVSWVVPLAEIGVGGALLADIGSFLADAAALLMMMIFTAVVAVPLRQGRQIDCNCYGFAATRGTGISTVARNTLLVALCLTALVTDVLLAVPASWGSLGPPGWRAVSGAGDVLAVAALGLGLMTIVYLIEWTMETWRLARVAMDAIRGIPS